MIDEKKVEDLENEIDDLKDALRTTERERDEAREAVEQKSAALDEIYDIARKNS